jgi:hypothetical protein
VEALTLVVGTIPDLKKKEPNSILASFIGLVQSHFGGASERWATCLFRMEKILLESLMPGQHAREFPTALGTHERLFGLEPKLIIRAACPVCCKSFAPNERGRYPTRCDGKEFEDSEECGGVLCKRKRGGDGMSYLVPRKPLVLQDFAAFKANMLQRKGMEELLELGALPRERAMLENIMDGSLMKELRGPDGRPFLGSGDGELRTVWGYSMDYFQRDGNKQGARKYGIGVQSLDCKQLPPSVAHRPENIFVAAVMPGPGEPHGEQINRYLEPVIDQLNESYDNGDFYERTYRFPHGRTERSMVCVIISDLKANLQLSGLPHFSRSGEFCSFDHQQKADIQNIDVSSWRPRDAKETRIAMERWRNAETQTEREQIHKETGIRPSALWNLRYFRPEMIVVDGMHNLFEGDAKHHFSKILGFHESYTRKKETRPVTTEDIARATQMFERRAAETTLVNSNRANVLMHLLEMRGIRYGKNAQKRDMVSWLQVGVHWMPSCPI